MSSGTRGKIQNRAFFRAVGPFSSRLVIYIDITRKYLKEQCNILTIYNNEEIRIKSAKNINDKDITIYLPKNKLYLFDNNKIRLKT